MTNEEAEKYILDNRHNVKTFTGEHALKMVRANPMWLENVPDHEITTEMCTIAAKYSGTLLNCIPYRMRTKEICIECIKTFQPALQFVNLDNFEVPKDE